MRLSITLADDLYRAVSACAAAEGCTPESLITRLIEEGIELRDSLPAPEPRPLPFIAKAATGGVIPALTNQQLAELEELEDLKVR
jgi:hypothetical protein